MRIYNKFIKHLAGTFFVKNLIFSLGFGIYGFTRGYRAIESDIKYNIEMNYEKLMYKPNKNKQELLEMKEKELKSKLSNILITDKIKIGIFESIFYFVPFYNLIQIFNLIRRIDVYLHVPKQNYSQSKYNEIFTFWWFEGKCYDII